MSLENSGSNFYIGWDVGGWNCDKNQKSKDAIVIIDSNFVICGMPWKGNLRDIILNSENTVDCISKIFNASNLDYDNHSRVTLAIDTPLGFSMEYIDLITNHKCAGIRMVGNSSNQYLFRRTERFLFAHGLKPLSAVKDQIGSQATKGMHAVAKFSPNNIRCGVWGDGSGLGSGLLTSIEAYPSSCKNSNIIKNKLKSINNKPRDKDKYDALICALVANLYDKSPNCLIHPNNTIPWNEGWIWVPRDFYYNFNIQPPGIDPQNGAIGLGA